MKGILNVWLWEKKTIVEDRKEEKSIIAIIVGDEKKEE
jgi:hypothetical protein